jgi:hypothetical protein
MLFKQLLGEFSRLKPDHLKTRLRLFEKIDTIDSLTPSIPILLLLIILNRINVCISAVKIGLLNIRVNTF